MKVKNPESFDIKTCYHNEDIDTFRSSYLPNQERQNLGKLIPLANEWAFLAADLLLLLLILIMFIFKVYA